MTEYYLMVMVDTDENAALGVIERTTYDSWNDGHIDTDAEDHASLFWSDHVTQKDSYADAITLVASMNGEIVGVIGGLLY